MLNIDIISCLNDNYSYLIHDDKKDIVAVIDPSDFNPINEVIEKKYNKLDFILNTHHHFDHVGGNIKLKEKFKCKIAGFISDKKRIPGIDILLKENDDFSVGEISFNVIFTPGHTNGHIAFYAKKEKVVFTGDTFFSFGCGRVFEGTFNQMYDSIKKIKSLPSDTKIYFGHEYTKGNLIFCMNYDKNNEFLKKKILSVDELLSKNLRTSPSILSDELKGNVFLRCDDLSIKSSLKLRNSTEEEVFKKLRDLKDNF